MPNQLFINNKKENEISYINIFEDDKVIMVFDYLYTNTNRRDISFFTIKDIIESNGFKINRSKNKINSKVINIINKMIELKLITGLTLPEKIDVKDMFKCKINIIGKYEGRNIQFVKYMDRERAIIDNIVEEGIDKLILTKLFLNLKTRIYTNGKGGLVQEVCFPSYKTISEDIGMSEATIKKYLDILVSYKLIAYKEGLSYYIGNKNNMRYLSNTYALYKDDGTHRADIRRSMDYVKSKYEEEGAIFVEVRNNNRSLGGKKTQLSKKVKLGTATQEDIDMLKDIEDKLTYTPVTKLEIRDDLRSKIVSIYQEIQKHNENFRIKELIGDDKLTEYENDDLEDVIDMLEDKLDSLAS